MATAPARRPTRHVLAGDGHGEARAERHPGVTISNGGTGYANGIIPYFVGGGGAGATATANVTAGVISAVTVTNAGAGYTTAPTVGLEGPVNHIVVTNGGTGCTSVPVVHIAAPANVGQPGPLTTATAVATVQNGTVTAITLTNAGAGYTTNPAVTFTGNTCGVNLNATAVAAAGGGSGAVITTSLAPSSVTGITVTNAGGGYLAAPTVTISGGGGTGATATAYLDNSALLADQQTDPETLNVVACSTTETSSKTATQKFDFQLAKPDVTLVSTPVSPTGNLDTMGTVGVGQSLTISTSSDFVGQQIYVNYGATATNCSGANGGAALHLNGLNGVTGAGVCYNPDAPAVGAPGLPACNSFTFVVGQGNGAVPSAANPLPKGLIPAVGTPLVLNAIACPENGNPTQLDSTVTTSSLTLTAAQPTFASLNQTATPGPVSLTYENNEGITITSPTATIRAAQHLLPLQRYDADLHLGSLRRSFPAPEHPAGRERHVAGHHDARAARCCRLRQRDRRHRPRELDHVFGELHAERHPGRPRADEQPGHLPGPHRGRPRLRRDQHGRRARLQRQLGVQPEHHQPGRPDGRGHGQRRGTDAGSCVRRHGLLRDGRHRPRDELLPGCDGPGGRELLRHERHGPHLRCDGGEHRRRRSGGLPEEHDLPCPLGADAGWSVQGRS